MLRWFEVNEPIRGGLAGPPDRIEEYFIYQTLVGVWPLAVDRVENYMEKAMREAKRNSNWLKPEVAWEAGVLAFVGALYDHEPFLETFQPFVQRVAAAGERALLGQIALKLTAPGVPDIYNGDELPYRALVDPDNRRPVDWDERRRQLEEPTDAKFRLTKELLALRARRPEAFAGDYEPLDAGDGTVAYFRGGDVLVAVAVRDDVTIDVGESDEWEPVLADWPGITVLERRGR